MTWSASTGKPHSLRTKNSSLRQRHEELLKLLDASSLVMAFGQGDGIEHRHRADGHQAEGGPFWWVEDFAI